MNSIPHIGHLFEFILADSLTKYYRQNGRNVYFNTGIDEHGIKVYSKSVELNIPIKEHLDNLNDIWLDFCKKFNIDYDNFYRTSSSDHHEKVKVIWNKFLERGDIYKKDYTGKYCVGCESFKVDKEIINNKCPEHTNLKLQDVNEENYFFKLTKYKDILFNWIESTPEFLEPKSKIDELKNLITSSEDISISRLKENCPWGVDVPGDDKHIIYVWFDALLNYIFAAGYLTDNFNWDNVIQLCGPDNLRFQAVIFQSFLESEGIKKSSKLLVHGTILDKEGKKISKSLGNTIDPIDQLNKYGVDPIKYYSLCGLSTYTNSNWNEEDLIRIWNSDVCNDWGNLISRTLHLIDTKLDGNTIDVDNDFSDLVRKAESNVKQLWEDFKIKEALQKTNELVKFANKYINEVKPWALTDSSKELSNLYYLIGIVNKLYTPVLPNIEESLKLKKKSILFNRI